MTLALLVLATIVDLGLAALLIAVSGFVFGQGPEGMHGAPSAAAAWTMMLVVCLAAPILGFVLRAHDRASRALLVAWFPAIGALVFALSAANLALLR